MNNLLGDVKGTELSVIKDPFGKDHVGDIIIHYRSTCIDKPYWVGSVEFRNGNTKGEQRTPHCDTFEELVAAMKQIMDSVNK